MVSQVHSLTAATGAIVPGNSWSGDKVAARLNSGEMVLNSSQQYRLWNLANGRSALQTGDVGQGGKVEFEIHGNVLRGVLKNTNKSLKRAGRKTDL